MKASPNLNVQFGIFRVCESLLVGLFPFPLVFFFLYSFPRRVPITAHQSWPSGKEQIGEFIMMVNN